jgi:DNA repair exonuclease SbcCD ATPase subunit
VQARFINLKQEIMKTNMIKGMITTGMAVMLATGAFAGDMKAAMQHIRANQQKVNQDLTKINRQQERVKTAGQNCRTEKTAAAHKEYKDAKADLREYKKELKADNKDLMKAHQEHIKIHKEEVKAERKAVQKYQVQLDRDKAMGKPVALNEADKLMNARAEMRERLTDMERARLERDKDRWVVMREYNDMSAKTSMQLASYTTGGETNTASK